MEHYNQNPKIKYVKVKVPARLKRLLNWASDGVRTSEMEYYKPDDDKKIGSQFDEIIVKIIPEAGECVARFRARDMEYYFEISGEAKWLDKNESRLAKIMAKLKGVTKLREGDTWDETKGIHFAVAKLVTKFGRILNNYFVPRMTKIDQNMEKVAIFTDKIGNYYPQHLQWEEGDKNEK